MAEDFVPVMLYQKKAPDILKQYEIRAFPTFIIIDHSEKELMRQVGSPFRTPEEAREWFPEIGEALASVSDLEAKYEEDGENADVAIELADTYSKLGKADEAIAIYEKISEGMSEEDEGYVDFQFKYAEMLTENRKGAEAVAVYEGLIEALPEDSDRVVDATLGLADAKLQTINRNNEAEVAGEINEIYNELLPALIEAGDDRAIDPAILNARIEMIVNKDNEAARNQMTGMFEAYAKHDRILEIKYWAAFFASENGDTDTAKAEYQAIIDAGEAGDRWVENAKKALEALNKEG